MSTSRIKLIHTDCLSALGSILLSGKKLFKYINIFDNQIDELIAANNYSFATPAAFIEFIPGTVAQMGLNMSNYPDAIFKIHFINQCLDGGGDTMEQNLEIFDIRDLVKTAMIGANIRWCSKFQQTAEGLDYKHKGVYKYTLSFKTNFIDSKGSILDPDSGAFGFQGNIGMNLNTFILWSVGNYTAGVSVVCYRGDIYLCSVTNSDTEFTVAHWTLVEGWTVKSWIVGDYCFYGNYVYICSTANSDTTFNAENWTLV